MVRLIDADALDRAMYHKSFEVDDGRTMWNSGCWIRYKIYEEASREAPTVDAIPVEWMENRECKPDEAYAIRKMFDEWQRGKKKNDLR